jgi:uncharacterized protein YbjT (DUF2867 family)
MILVTGATGNVGGALAAQLAETGRPFRALTRNPSNPHVPPGLPLVQGDLFDADSLGAALDGVDSIFLVRSGNEAAVLEAAKRAGVRKVVFLSSLAAQTRPASMIGGGHLQAEHAVVAAGLPWTILRPGLLASNTRLWAGPVRESGEVRAPYADVALPAIHPGDVASVGSVVLTEEGHDGQIYHLSGPEPISAAQRAEALAEALGRPLRFTGIGHEEGRRQLLQFMPEPIADETLALTGAPLPEELPVLPTVEKLTGRPGRTFLEWARENAAAFR